MANGPAGYGYKARSDQLRAHPVAGDPAVLSGEDVHRGVDTAPQGASELN